MPALSMRTYTMRGVMRDPERMRRAAAFVTSGPRGGALGPVVDRLFPLEETVRAHQHLESNTHVDKIVVTVGH
ncbi:zinc-binding dehydrogenase [Streptomyces sp. MJM1172]|uniref:zinc-binding dehydrogenase n=1 Tax=Streptomyces sp. MJM1172 TaxID=1703926 RepID=UPI00093A3524|nr:zinc-binding dehydrogenase [Streptomyces sp. MJM1172]OKI58310.1 hypothetical protein AMK15_23370 [Streptomyces sp. MJM1172]